MEHRNSLRSSVGRNLNDDRADVIRVPSRLNCWGTGIVFGLLAMLLNGAVRVLLYGGTVQALTGFDFVIMSVHGFFLGVLAGLFRWHVRRKRRLLLYRFQIIADCNHHIRNALQAIVFKSRSADVREDLDRIERVLQEVLPRTLTDELPEWGKTAPGRPTVPQDI